MILLYYHGATSNPAKDHELTRYARYLIVQNGDPRKEVIKSLKSLSFSNFDDLKWFNSGRSILTSVPLSVTAHETYSRMSNVIFLIAVMVLALAAWAGSIDEKYISNVVKEYSELGMNQVLMTAAIQSAGKISPADDGRVVLNWEKKSE